MRKVLGMLICLLLLSATGSILQGRDRYRDRRAFRKNVEIFVTTPYGGGYFVRGNPYYGRYADYGHGPYRDKHWRKHYNKRLKRFHSGYANYHDHDCRGRHRHHD